MGGGKEDIAHAGGVCGQHRLGAAREIDASDLPVQAAAEGFVVVAAEAYVEHGSAMLELVEQLAAGLGERVVEVDMAIPRRDEEAR